MSVEEAQKSVNGENRSAPIVKCQQWEYDQDVIYFYYILHIFKNDN